MKKKTNLKQTFISLAAILLVCILTLTPAVAADSPTAETDSAEYNGVRKNDPTAAERLLKYGMLPIYGSDIKDGTYAADVNSSSPMFSVTKAELHVKNGKITANITVSGTDYSKLYMGSGKKAAKADLSDLILCETENGSDRAYTIPVKALNCILPCASYSDSQKQWYDRSILVDASSLSSDALLVELPDYDLIEDALNERENKIEQTETTSSDHSENREPAEAMSIDREDGEYSIEVTLSGGSGKATVNSPTLLIVKDGKAYARLQWSSSNYDYMIVGTEKYLNTAEENANSVFEIPIEKMDEEMSVTADTTAMGTPHEVDYSLTFYRDSIGSKSQMPQEAAKRVIAVAVIIIIGGGILNHFSNKRKRA